SPTVKEGYILRVSNDLLNVMEQTTGTYPVAFPISMQDITPYGNDLYHINSIFQPAVVTSAPVVGVGITSQTPIAGPATGVSNPVQIDAVGRFVIEVAKAFGARACAFYDEAEFAKLQALYGSMTHLQGRPRAG